MKGKTAQGMDEMKAYMGRTAVQRIVMAIAGAVCLLLGIMQISRESTVMGVILSAVGVFLLISAVLAKSQDARYMRALEERGELEAAARDFAASEVFADDKLRIGNAYLFRKNGMEVLTIEDIAGIFKTHGSDPGDEHYGADYLSLFAELTNGKSVLLCRLYGAEQDALGDTIISALQVRNSAIQMHSH